MPNVELKKSGGHDYGTPGLSKVKGSVSGINSESEAGGITSAEYRMGGTGSPDDQTFKPFGSSSA